MMSKYKAVEPKNQKVENCHLIIKHHTYKTIGKINYI